MPDEGRVEVDGIEAVDVVTVTVDGRDGPSISIDSVGSLVSWWCSPGGLRRFGN